MNKLMLSGKIHQDDELFSFQFRNGILTMEFAKKFYGEISKDLLNFKGFSIEGSSVLFLNCEQMYSIGNSKFLVSAVIISDNNNTSSFSKIKVEGGSLNSFLKPLDHVFDNSVDLDLETFNKTGAGTINVLGWEHTDFDFYLYFKERKIKSKIGVPRKFPLTEDNLKKYITYFHMDFKEQILLEESMDLIIFMNKVISYLTWNSDNTYFDTISLGSYTKNQFSNVTSFRYHSKIYVNFRQYKDYTNSILISPHDYTKSSSPTLIGDFIKYVDKFKLGTEVILGYNQINVDKHQMLNSTITFEHLWEDILVYHGTEKYKNADSADLEVLESIKGTVNEAWKLSKSSFLLDLKQNLSNVSDFSLKDKMEFALSNSDELFDYIKRTVYGGNQNSNYIMKDLKKIVSFRNAFAHGSESDALHYESINSYKALIRLNYFYILKLSGYLPEGIFHILDKILLT